MEKIIKKVFVTKEQLKNKLLNFEKEIAVTGTAFGNLVYFTQESGSKTVNKEKVLQKFVRTNITLGASYENRVNRDLVKQDEESNFTAQEMTGKKYISKVLATDTKTEIKTYLVGVVEHRTNPVVIYFHAGKRISKDEAIKQNLFMPSYFTEKKTSGRGNMQEITDFHMITLNIENLISLTLNKTKYIVLK